MQVCGGVPEALSVAVEEVLDPRTEHPVGVKVSDRARSARQSRSQPAATGRPA
jgi:hypothetical protein